MGPAGRFEESLDGFVKCAWSSKLTKGLDARVSRTSLENLETKVLALRALHAKPRGLDTERRTDGAPRQTKTLIRPFSTATGYGRRPSHRI